MKKELKQFLITTLVFFSGNVLSKIANFFLLPLYTSRLPTSDYGNFDLVVTILSFVVPIIFFQIWDGMYRFSFDKDKCGDKPKVISNSTFVFLCGTILYILIALVVGLTTRMQYFLLIAAYGLSYGLIYIHTYACRVYMKNVLFVVSGLVNTAIQIGLNLFLILGKDMGVESLYISLVAGSVAQIVLIEGFLGVFRKINFKTIDKKLIKDMIKFSIPLCIATASYWLLSGFTKILISTTLGSSENGLYAVANKFGSLITLFVTAFQFGWNEMAYIMSNDKNKDEKYTICINLVITIILYVTACFLLLVKVIFPYFIGADYQDAIYIMPATLIGVAFNSLAGFVATVFMSNKKTNFVMISTLIAAAINIGLGFLLAHFFALQGAVIALGVSFTLLAVLRLIHAYKTTKFKISIKHLIGLAALVGSVVVFYLVNNMIVLIIVALAIAALFVLIFYQDIKKIILKAKSMPKNNEEKEQKEI